MHSAVIALGSNIDAARNIEQAIRILYSRFDVQTSSGPVKTTPVGVEDQPDFLNAALLLKTGLEQSAIVQELKAIEDEMGRDRSREKFGPREIDLDLVAWDQQIVDDDYYDRDFLRKLVDDVLKK